MAPLARVQMTWHTLILLLTASLLGLTSLCLHRLAPLETAFVQKFRHRQSVKRRLTTASGLLRIAIGVVCSQLPEQFRASTNLSVRAQFLCRAELASFSQRSRLEPPRPPSLSICTSARSNPTILCQPVNQSRLCVNCGANITWVSLALRNGAPAGAGARDRESQRVKLPCRQVWSALTTCILLR